MFLAAVARPMKISTGVWFDGKIGIWPIVDTKVARRTSKHRPKGTKVLVPVMVDGERNKKLMIEEVIPAIKACMPRAEGHTIFVGQGGDHGANRGGGGGRYCHRNPASQLT
ncbi:unnamed protein product [Discosporangium mesarthrocarpum]